MNAGEFDMDKLADAVAPPPGRQRSQRVRRNPRERKALCVLCGFFTSPWLFFFLKMGIVMP
jgi:hypothetical protein